MIYIYILLGSIFSDTTVDWICLENKPWEIVGLCRLPQGEFIFVSEHFQHPFWKTHTVLQLPDHLSSSMWGSPAHSHPAFHSCPYEQDALHLKQGWNNAIEEYKYHQTEKSIRRLFSILYSCLLYYVGLGQLNPLGLKAQEYTVTWSWSRVWVKTANGLIYFIVFNKKLFFFLN